jgi:hypothetical protein
MEIDFASGVRGQIGDAEGIIRQVDRTSGGGQRQDSLSFALTSLQCGMIDEWNTKRSLTIPLGALE